MDESEAKHTPEDTHPEKKVQRPCICCAKADPEYECFPCRCNVYCKKCAMKLATGGKCKKCGSLFASMAHIGQLPADEVEEEADA